MNTLIFEWLLIIFSLRKCTGLYEDQIGKFEWRKQYVGKLKYAHLDVVSPIKKVVVATEQNVVAALSLKSGDIIWRQILEPEENGSIFLLSVDKEVLTVSGKSSPLVRGWNLEHGHLLWEWGVSSFNEFSSWISFRQKLVQLDFHPSSHIVATLYQSSTGRKIKVQVIPAAWLKPENCVVQNNVVACANSDKILYSIKIVEENDDLGITVHHRSLLDLFQEEVTGKLRKTAGKLPIVNLKVGNTDKTILLQPEIKVIESGNALSQISSSTIVDQQSLITTVEIREKNLNIATRTLDGNILPDLTNDLNYADTHGDPEFVLIVCQPRKDKGVACRIVISTSHDTILLIQHPGKILWSREESLSSIVTSELVDLPASDRDVAIEKEFDNKNTSSNFGISSGFIGMFFRRIISQTLQLQNLILTVLGLLKGVSNANENQLMVQDEFGLHKLIVAVTKTGKIYGIDNLSGKIVWQIKIDGIKPFSCGTTTPSLPLYLLRSARHHPLASECAVLAKKKSTGETVIVAFDPINGHLVHPKSVIELGFKIKQSLQFHQIDENFYKGILLLDEDNNVHVYPESSKLVALKDPSSLYMYTANAASGVMEGFALSVNSNQNLIVTKTWQICLGNTIVAAVGKNSNERVHSQGRVLGDRSVLYKYVNPNLISVITRATHPSHKTIINLHLVDIVSGNIIYSLCHRRAKEPVHIVHSENWVVYTYFNEKYRRTELGALEMYEGKTQTNSSVFSSFDSVNLLPIVERQAYILPAYVLFLKETITEKGITSKHILVALSSGGILELPWAYVDPRRPLTGTPEMREEGVIPYMPELTMPVEAIINHNQTINNIRGIHTTSSGLESTCLVFAYGLDVFYTRVSPSKTFDLLKEDFDYYLITLVLMALSIISYVTKKLASRRALKQAWK